jgi:hypothetical protein
VVSGVQQRLGVAPAADGGVDDGAGRDGRQQGHHLVHHHGPVAEGLGPLQQVGHGVASAS